MVCDSYTTYYGESRCLGTKEIDRCGCEGDESKCDFIQRKERRLKRR